jgi:hypothetical protein
MLFVEFDHGMIVRKGTERHTSRIIRLVIGNPLIMREMAKHVPDAGSYAPRAIASAGRAGKATHGLFIAFALNNDQPPVLLCMNQRPLRLFRAIFRLFARS